MPAVSKFKPFATGGGAAVTPNATWLSAGPWANGFSTGILTKELLNTALRQASVPSAALMQAVAEILNTTVEDDGNQATLVTQIKDAMAAYAVGALTSNSVTYTPFGTGAVATTLQAKERQTVSVFDFMTAAQIADVKAGTLLYDCWPAFVAAMVAMEVLYRETYYNPLGRLFAPAGKYRMSQTLQVEGAVEIFGEGPPDGNNLGSTRLYFDDNRDGIVINDYRTSSNGRDAGGTIIQGLSVICNRTSGTVGSGIWLRTRARIRDVVVYNFREHGVKIRASAGSGGLTEGNANNWEITSARFVGNGVHGLFVDGADVNAGVATRVDASGNGEIGIYDSSFLGNTYVACHAADNGAAKAFVSYLSGRYFVVHDTLGGATTPGTDPTVWELQSSGRVSYGGNRYACLDANSAALATPGTNPAVWSLLGAGGVSLPEFPQWSQWSVFHIDGPDAYYPAWASGATYKIGGPYRTDNANARNAFIGCYSEGGQPAALLQGPSHVVSGLHGAGFSSQSSATLQVEKLATATRFYQNGTFNDHGNYHGVLGATSSIMALTDPAEAGGSFPVRLKGKPGRFMFDWANNEGSLLELTNSLATVANGFPREVATRMAGGGGVAMRQGYFNGPYMKHRGTGTAAPVTGTYVQGDYVENEAYAELGTAGSKYIIRGWACTAAGAPGTWVADRGLTGN